MVAASENFPWLWPYGVDAAWHESALGEAGSIARALSDWRELVDQPVFDDLPRFMPSTDTLGALEYERCVYKGQIPTRDISHDWYNGQVWLKFAGFKTFINSRHIADSESAIIQSANGRSRLRDALTLFDESGALLLTTSPATSTALLSHDWHSLFVADREVWPKRSRVLIVGHGLLDSMHSPHKGLCAKAIPVQVPSLNLNRIELQNLVLQAAKQIQDPANLSPLPVMGVPGWFDESKVPGYYNDTAVYRAKPTRRVSSLHERLAFVWDGSTLSSGKCAGQSLPEFQGEESPDSSEHGAG